MKFLKLILICSALLSVAACSSPRPKAPKAGFFAPTGWKVPIAKANVKQVKAQQSQFVGVQEPRSGGTSNYLSKTKIVQPTEQMEGFSSWYGPGFHGKKTANGESYNQMGMTAAHRYLPMNTWLRVRNLENGKSIVVRVNDRGPYKKNRILDLTKRASKKLGFFDQGTAKVQLEVLKFPKEYDPKKGMLAYKQVVVQLAVFRDQKRAADYATDLHRRYTKLEFMVDKPREGAYQVVIGPFAKREEAKKISSQLGLEGVQSFVRSYRK